MQLNDIRDLESQRQTSREAAYRDLVADLADDTDLASEDILDVLELSGKTSSDLDADVQRLQRRRALQAKMDAAKFADADRAEALGALEKMDLKFEAQRREYEASRRPLLARIETSKAALSQAKDAERELRKTAPDELKAEYSRIVQSIDALARQIHDLRKKAAYADEMHRQNVAVGATDRPTSAVGDGFRRDTELLEGKITKLRAELADVTATMLEP